VAGPAVTGAGGLAPAVCRTSLWQGLRAVDVLLAVLLLGLWTFGLGGAPLFDVDEGAFAEASREMLVSGDWMHTTLNGADRFDKPILVYWLQAASLRLLGVNEAAVRLPSALCAWGWCLALAAFAGPRWGRAAGWAAAGVLATSLGPMVIGRAATADALLNLLLTLTALDLWRWMEVAASDPSAGAAARRRAFVWAGLGLLAKGPVAVLVPGGALMLWALGSGGATRRVLGQGLRDPWAWALMLGVAAPWYALACLRHGQAFIGGFVLHHNLGRFTQPLEGHRGSVAYHLLALPVLLLPWTPGLWELWRRRRLLWMEPCSRYLLGWTAFVLLFFSLAATKLPHYTLYGFTPLALLVGRHLVRQPWHRGKALAVGLPALALGMLGTAGPLVADVLLAVAPSASAWSERLAAVAVPASAGEVGLLALALVGVLTIVAIVPSWWRAPVLAALCAGVTVQWSTAALPWWGRAMQGPVRGLAEQARLRGLPLVQWQLHQPSVGFYRQQAAPRRVPVAGEVALVRSDVWPSLVPPATLTVSVLARAPGFLLVRALPRVSTGQQPP
jgi:4-amino-4-deoxy-L-arabinose transferase-like glycosyltransferase